MNCHADTYSHRGAGISGWHRVQITTFFFAAASLPLIVAIHGVKRFNHFEFGKCLLNLFTERLRPSSLWRKDVCDVDESFAS